MTRDRGPRPSPGSAATSLPTRGHAFFRVFHSDSWLQEVSRPQARGEPPRRAQHCKLAAGTWWPLPPQPCVGSRPPCSLEHLQCEASAVCRGGGMPPAPAPDAPLSCRLRAQRHAGEGQAQHLQLQPPHHRQEDTYVPGATAGRGRWPRTHAEGSGRESSSPRGHPGTAGQRAPWRGRGGASGGTLCIPRRCPVPHSQPARLHARPETGPGPTGHSWHTEVGLQQVQAQGGCPQSPQGAAAHRAEGGVGRASLAWGWYRHCTHGAPRL